MQALSYTRMAIYLITIKDNSTCLLLQLLLRMGFFDCFNFWYRKPECVIFDLQPVCTVLGFSPIKALLQADWIGRHCYSAPQALYSPWS